MHDNLFVTLLSQELIKKRMLIKVKIQFSNNKSHEEDTFFFKDSSYRQTPKTNQEQRFLFGGSNVLQKRQRYCTSYWSLMKADEMT